jgi:hypothetical protein
MRLPTPEPHNNHEIDLCSEKTIPPYLKAETKIEQSLLC